jgi:phosphatidylglycerol:prolipoprotein diacylglycerol transferase
MTLTGVFAGGLLAHYEMKRRGQDPAHIWNILALGVVLGLIGARLYHVIDLWNEYYSQNPGEIIAIWHGGQGIYGALIGALLALYIYTRWQKLDLAMYADVGVIGFLLGQAVGRWGNFFNQELYGPPTDLPWGIPIDFDKRVPQYSSFTHFHPLFLYESLLSLLGVVTLFWISRRFKGWLKPGDIAFMYGIWYPTERFLLEFLRIDPWKLAGIATAQWVSGAIVLGCAFALWWRHRKPGAGPLQETGGPGLTGEATGRLPTSTASPENESPGRESQPMTEEETRDTP